jgi:hypothetical protein
MSCENSCLKISLEPCQTSIKVNSNLAATTNYTYKVTDSRGNTYTKAITTDADGNFSLVAADFPDSLFCSVTDHLTLEVYQDVNSNQRSSMAITQLHECITIKFGGIKDEIGE